jgi:hypothetical protein
MSDSPTEIVASIFFDSWLDESPQVRAAGSANDRHLIFEGNGVIVDLLLKPLPAGASSHVSGKVLLGSSDMKSFAEVANLGVSLHRPEGSLSTNTNGTGEFTFNLVPAGTWTLTVMFRDRHFIVRGLSNQERRSWRPPGRSAGRG